METALRGLDRNYLARPPILSRDGPQMQLWQRLLDLEKSNPLELADPNEFIQRVQLVYRQYLLCFAQCSS